MDLYEDGNIYLNVCSKDSISYFPNNKTASFRVKLAKPLHLKGCWKLGLCEIHVSGVNVNANGAENIRIECNLCKGLIVNGTQTRTLRTLPLKKNQYKIFPLLYYVPLETHYIDNIDFNICGSEDKLLSFEAEDGRVEMTLRLKRCC